MVLHDQVFSLFALVERKKRKQEKKKYRGSRDRQAAAEGKTMPHQPQNADCVRLVNIKGR